VPLFKDLSKEALADIARLLLLRHIPAGEMVFKQSDPGEAMYIVDSGTIEAMAESPGKPRELIGRFVDGDFFGEAALLTGKTRSFTAYAIANTNLWGLYRTDFDHLLVKYPQISVALSKALRDSFNSSESYTVEPHLKRIALLGGLSRLQLDELSARLQPRRYQAGSSVYAEGRASNEMYFIERGQVEHWATTLQGPMLLENLGPSDFCGEIALLSGKGHLTTAYAVTETDIWVLTKADFDDFLQRYPNLAVTFTRILSERLEQTMGRMRGTAPQRGLPPGAGYQPGPPPAQPYGPPSGPVNPSRPASTPPVRLHRVGGGAPPARPVYSLPPQASPPGPQRPPLHSQYTQPIPPVSPHSQFTQGMPLQRPPVHSQQTLGLPAVQPGPASRPLPTRRPEPAPARPRGPAQKGKKRDSRPQAPTGPRSKGMPRQRPAPQQPLRQPAPPRQLPPPANPAAARVTQTDWPAQAGPGGVYAPQSQPAPSRSSRRLDRENLSGFSVWFAQLSLGAKLRLLAIILIIIWLCGIMAPSWLIQALAANFEDNGAVPGDPRSIVNQVRQDGPRGALAALPFVETATPTPTETSTPTETPTPTSTVTETPLPTWTPTPTWTSTPTETPTPIFTPTPTDTPTRAFTRTPSPPTETPTPAPTATPDVDFLVVKQRQLTPCENHGKHHIFIRVVDAAGQGINGMTVQITKGSEVFTAKTETKQNVVGQLEPGHIDFAMFKGSYDVQVLGATSQVATGITPDFGVNEACGEDAVANSLFHQSYEVVFQRTY
jgi:CRP-like cAMP-binding protein